MNLVLWRFWGRWMKNFSKIGQTNRIFRVLPMSEKKEQELIYNLKEAYKTDFVFKCQRHMNDVFFFNVRDRRTKFFQNQKILNGNYSKRRKMRTFVSEVETTLTDWYFFKRKLNTIFNFSIQRQVSNIFSKTETFKPEFLRRV